MLKLLTTNYAGRIGEIIETRMQWYKVHWLFEQNGTVLNHISWIDKRDAEVVL